MQLGADKYFFLQKKINGTEKHLNNSTNTWLHSYFLLSFMQLGALFFY